jgi:hypothetical protein
LRFEQIAVNVRRFPGCQQVSGKEVLKEGAVLVMPAAVVTLQSKEGMEVSGKTMHALGRTTHEPTPEEIEWLRSLILHMASYHMNLVWKNESQ